MQWSNKIFQGTFGRWFVQMYCPLLGTPLSERLCPEFHTEAQAKAWLKWRQTGRYCNKHPDAVRRGLKAGGVPKPNKRKNGNGS